MRPVGGLDSSFIIGVSLLLVLSYASVSFYDFPFGAWSAFKVSWGEPFFVLHICWWFLGGIFVITSKLF
jgi:hypothetical protein